MSIFKEQSKHIHFDAIYTKNKALKDQIKTIDYTQIYKDFLIDPNEVDKRVVVLCPLEMEYDELTERY